MSRLIGNDGGHASIFPNSLNDAVLPDSEPRDQRIARLLWIWSRDRKQLFGDGRSVEQHIASWLEPFLCDSFAYSPEGAKQGWWSDGVVDLQIDRFAATAFLLWGSAWWAGHDVNKQWVAPFEIEFYFTVEGSLDFSRTIVRFGGADVNGDIVRSSMSLHPRIRNNGQPSKNSHWAMAIELTPPKAE